MMKSILKFLILFAFVFIFTDSYATHLLGSEITYECVGPNRYRVRLTVYQDCAGMTPGSTMSLRYRSAQCGVNTTITLNQVGSAVDITPLCPSGVSRCSSSSGAYGIREFVYEGIINLPPGCGTDWQLSWSQCCRNNAINNLTSPGNQNMGVSANLDNTIQPICNNSPVFNNEPAAILCVNQPFVYNHGVSDPDGDSLYFSLGNCIVDVGTQVNYSGSWNGSNPLPTVSGVTINPNTGAISFTPNQTFVGVLCVKVEEYRNGVKIGEVNRDMQFRVINCSNTPPTATGVDGAPNNDPTNFEISVCANSEVCFNIFFADNNSDNMIVSWNQEIPGATFTVSNNGTQNPTALFCWQPPTSAIGQNVFSVNVVDDACPIVGSGTYTYIVTVTPSPNTLDAGPNQTICQGESAILTASSTPAAITYTWSPAATLSSSTGQSVTATPLVTTTYEVSAEFPDGCNLTDVVTVVIAPNPVISITPLNPFNCANQNNTITATASNAVSYAWSPGGMTTATINVAPAVTTTYTVTATSQFGCTSEASTTVEIAAPAGNVCNVLHVTPTGLPTASGTRSDPMDLQTAMTVGACNGTIIKMAIGDYVTDTTINRVTSYLTLEGGFDANVNWEKVSTMGLTRIFRTATMTTSTTNGTGIENEAPPYPPDPNVTAIRVVGQSGFRFQDLTVEVVGFAGGSPIIGYRGVTTKGIELNACDGYNIVRTNVQVGAASNGSDSWCVAPATAGGSSFGIDIISNGANGNIITSRVIPGAAGAGGAGCGGFPAGAAGVSQNVRVTGTALATPYVFFDLGAQTTIRMDDIACTNTLMDFRTAASNNWAFGVGSSPANATGATVTTMYTNLGRKTITYGGSNYVGFANIILDDQIIPQFTTSAPFVQGQYRVCAGETVSFNVLNGGVGYTYVWSDGVTTLYSGVGSQYETFLATLSTPGVYNVQLNFETSCCGLSLPANLTLYVEEQPDAVMPPDQEICFGSGVGTTLTVGGGVTGGSISWIPSTGLSSNNSYTVDAMPASTTTYEVTLSDSTGLCVDYAAITVAVIDLELQTNTINASCGPNGSAEVIVTGGSGNYSYLWTPTGQTAQSLNNLQVGTYVVLVTDNTNGCQDSLFAVVNPEPGTLVGFISNSEDVSCHGAGDGSITLSIVGGSGPFTYEWSTGIIETTSATSHTLSGLSGGDYDVTVTDDFGCTYEAGGSVFEPDVVTYIVDSIFDPTCAGVDDGYIYVTTDGGIAPFTYEWIGYPGVDTNVLSGLPSGTYTMIATDFNGCADSVEVTIQAPPIPEFVDDTTICAGTLYTFINGSQAVLFNDSLSLDTLADSDGCFYIQNVNITVLPLPTVSIDGDTTICAGDSALVYFNGTENATVTYTINGGADQTITLDGTGNATLNTGGLTSSIIVELVEIESATIPVCSQPITGTVSITVLELPFANIAGSTTLCEGDSTDIGFNGTPNAIVTYTINGGANQTVVLDGTGNATVNTGYLTADLDYQLVSVELQGTPSCAQLLSGGAFVTVLPLPSATISGSATICSGDNSDIVFNGTPNATVTYSINGGANQTVVLDGAGNATVNTGSLTEDATYTLLQIVSSSVPACTQLLDDSVSISVLDLPTASIIGDTVCTGQSGTVSFAGTPGATVTYTVNGGGIQTVVLNGTGNATVNTVALVANATYQLVSVESATTPACTQALTESALVSVVPLPTAAISGTTSVCEGEEANITFTGTANAVVSYTVNGGATQTVILNAGGTAIVPSGSLAATTTYQLVSVDNGTCTEAATGSAVITVNPTYSQTVLATICSNETYALPNGTLVNIAGSYPVTLVSSLGCDSTITTELTINQLGSFIPMRDFSACEDINGFTLNVQTQNMVSFVWEMNQGSGVYVPLDNDPWYEGANSNTLVFDIDTFFNGNIYRVTMVDQCDNVYTDEMRLNVYAPRPVENAVGDLDLCQHDLQTITVNYNGTNYEWNDGTEGPTIRPEVSGEYIVTFVENVTNCVMMDTINVTIEDCIATCVVLAPTGFTPDENGVNDIFRVVTTCDEGFEFFEFKIFNRWGELVYQTNNPRQGWDGWYKGRRAEIGVYAFYVEYMKNFGISKEIIKGNVTLVR
jgi:gliding motility-associated-like protein